MTLHSPTTAAHRPRGRVLRFEHETMATTFQLYLFDQSPNDAIQAAETVFREIDLLEKKMSFFIPGSEISQINGLRKGQSVIVSGATFTCMELGMKIYRQTDGAFDPTIGAMLKMRKRWDRPGTKHIEPPPQLKVGMNLVGLEEETRTVRLKEDHVMVDLGAIAKGYATDEAARILDDWGMSPAMIVAGQSSMTPLGLPPGDDGWLMRIRDPRTEKDVLKMVKVRTSISASANVTAKHILDPKTGKIADRTLGAWALASSGAESDALSTAFIVMPPQKVEKYCKDHPEISAMVFTAEKGLQCFGSWREAK